MQRHEGNEDGQGRSVKNNKIKQQRWQKSLFRKYVCPVEDNRLLFALSSRKQNWTALKGPSPYRDSVSSTSPAQEKPALGRHLLNENEFSSSKEAA